jgi:hypothetical protein
VQVEHISKQLLQKGMRFLHEQLANFARQLLIVLIVGRRLRTPYQVSEKLTTQSTGKSSRKKRKA